MTRAIAAPIPRSIGRDFPMVAQAGRLGPSLLGSHVGRLASVQHVGLLSDALRSSDDVLDCRADGAGTRCRGPHAVAVQVIHRFSDVTGLRNAEKMFSAKHGQQDVHGVFGSRKASFDSLIGHGLSLVGTVFDRAGGWSAPASRNKHFDHARSVILASDNMAFPVPVPQFTGACGLRANRKLGLDAAGSQFPSLSIGYRWYPYYPMAAAVGRLGTRALHAGRSAFFSQHSSGSCCVSVRAYRWANQCLGERRRQRLPKNDCSRGLASEHRKRNLEQLFGRFGPINRPLISRSGLDVPSVPHSSTSMASARFVRMPFGSSSSKCSIETQGRQLRQGWKHRKGKGSPGGALGRRNQFISITVDGSRRIDAILSGHQKGRKHD